MKKALLVGINEYKDTPLRGCVNDVNLMLEVLTNLYRFRSENICILLNQEATKKGIVDRLKWLAEGKEEPAVRVLYFAGQGHYVPDENGDEPDGTDEAIVPYDYQTNGYLIDDDLKKLYDRFPAPGNLTLIMDCSHSGTNQRDVGNDSMYRFVPSTYEERKAIAAARKKLNDEQRQFVIQEVKNLPGDKKSNEEFQKFFEAAMKKFEKQRFGFKRTRENNILLAACQGDQNAADGKFDGIYHGAFTFYLAKALKEARGKITYQDLIAKVGKQLNDHSFQQTPQLECSTGREQMTAFALF